MKGLTLTISESNGKIAFDWGMKGMSNIDLSKIPTAFGLRDYIASKIGRASLFSRLRSVTASGISRIASVFRPSVQSEAPSVQRSVPTYTAPQAQKVASTTPQPSAPTISPNTPFYDFTRDDLGVQSSPQATSAETASAKAKTFALPFQAPATKENQTSAIDRVLKELLPTA